MTKRLLIREITLDDVDALYRIYSDERVTRYIPGLQKDPQEERRMTKAYIESAYAFYGFGLWAVFERSTGRLIGRVGLTPRQMEDCCVLELGYVIDAGHWRQGYAAEACEAAIRYAQEELDCEELSAFIRVENTASIALAEKLGFHYFDRWQQDGFQFVWYIKELCDTLNNME
ncbi:GNAT family N-acetyltransferase [Diplocloster hominis]|uniref:GNAT family N-acetyltransferase n=1 Tax=Diplocloster hominis TaxID=3079010 RepID=UPI0031BB35AE